MKKTALLILPCALIGAVLAVAQDTAPSASLIAAAGVQGLDPTMPARNAAESPDPFPAPSALGRPHMLVWNRVVSATGGVVTVQPFAVKPETVVWIWPAEGSFDGSVYSQVALDPPWAGGVVIVGNWRDLSTEVAWALGRKVIDVRREVR